MSVKKSFFIVIRLIFVLYSLHFMKDAFFKWDGYAFYMRFIDFVPDLSLSFVIWTGLGIILAVASWIFI